MGSSADWIARFAERLGVPAPDDADTEAILAMAGTAAHSSERTAAPVSAYLVALAGISPAEALAVAKELAAELAAAELAAAEPAPVESDQGESSGA